MILEIDGIISSCEVRKKLKQQGDPVILSFSGGKDAIAAWLALKNDGIEVVPYFCYLIPQLEFVENYMTYCESFFGCRIIRMPHPSLYRWLNRFTFQAPEHLEIIEKHQLPEFTFIDVENAVREDTGNLDSWTASGVRAADSIIRRTHFKTRGPMIEKTMKSYPVWDWKNSMISQEMKRAGIKLSVDYSIFGRSFDGIDFRFLKPIKENFPSDYQKIIDIFPLAELEIFRETLTN